MAADERIERARVFAEQAVFGGDTDGLDVADRELDEVEADLALARGRIINARFRARGEEDPNELRLFERAAELYQRLGDVRGEGESLFWIGIVHQVVRHDHDTGVAFFVRSLDLAEQAADKLTMSYALRHLGIAEHVAGRLEAAREHLEKSVRLRRELDFLPGVAANLIGLAYIAAAQGHSAKAHSLLDEATSLAQSSSAHGIMHSIDEARTNLT